MNTHFAYCTTTVTKTLPPRLSSSLSSRRGARRATSRALVGRAVHAFGDPQGRGNLSRRLVGQSCLPPLDLRHSGGTEFGQLPELRLQQTRENTPVPREALILGDYDDIADLHAKDVGDPLKEIYLRRRRARFPLVEGRVSDASRASELGPAQAGVFPQLLQPGRVESAHHPSAHRNTPSITCGHLAPSPLRSLQATVLDQMHLGRDQQSMTELVI